MTNGKIHILQVIDSLEPGGAEKIVYDLALGLDPAEYAVSVCSLRPQRAEALAQELISRGFVMHFLQRREGIDPGLIRSVHRLIRSERFDVVHGHMDGEFYGHVGAIGTRAAVVTTVHGVFRHGFARRVIPSIAGLVKRNASVAVSESLRKEYKCKHLIYNGVDVPEEAGEPTAAALGIAADPEDIVIGITGRLTEVKNHKNFLRAASLVSAAHPRVKFLIVGPGPLEQELKRFAEELGLGGKTIFTGFRADAREILKIMDISVLSSDSEGLPVVVLESMAAAKPMVAAAVGGIPEVVEDGVTGFLVPPRDSARLAGALLKLIEDRDLRMRMGRAARERVEQRFSREIMVKRYDELYRALLG